jgi:GPH family glycoside/pentoside/hexuronide:cation symporter
MSPELSMAWVIGFGFLFYACFTVWNMPYQSLLMEMTPDYNERTRVTEVRGYFQTIAGLANGWVWWFSRRMVFADPATGEASAVNGMRYISLVIGILIIVLGLIPAIFTKERYYESNLTKSQKKVGMFASLKETFSNRPFVILCIFILFFMVGTQFYDKFGLYAGTYYVLGGNWDAGSVFAGYGTFIYTIMSLSFIPVFRWLSERIGKPKCLFLALCLVLGAALTTWFTFNPAYPFVMLLSTAFIGVGYAGLWLMVPSMQIDVVDYDELKTGERREGNFASIFSWVLKFGFCLGALLSGPLIGMMGFDASAGEPSAEVLRNIRIGYIAFPVAALAVALVLLKFFPITPEKAAEIREQLEERRGKV